MDQEKKDAIFRIFVISGLILLSILVMYFSYKQSRGHYLNDDGSAKKEMQEVFRRKDVACIS